MPRTPRRADPDEPEDLAALYRNGEITLAELNVRANAAGAAASMSARDRTGDRLAPVTVDPGD